jgi:phosphoribosylformylglycinamidine synthase
MIGIVKDMKHRCSVPFKDEGDIVVLLGHEREEFDLDLERRVQLACLEMIRIGIAKSAHDLSEGGLAVALAECSILSGMGAVVNLAGKMKEPALLFGEAQSRIILTIESENVFSLSDVAMLYQVPCSIIGKTGGKNLTIMKEKKTLVNIPVAKMKERYFSAIPELLKRN